jgi:hypothetical protein
MLTTLRIFDQQVGAVAHDNHARSRRVLVLARIEAELGACLELMASALLNPLDTCDLALREAPPSHAAAEPCAVLSCAG